MMDSATATFTLPENFSSQSRSNSVILERLPDVLLLAGILGWRGVLQASAITGMVAFAVGGFVAVALKDRWKRIRWGGGEIEMRQESKQNWLRRLYGWTIHWAATPQAVPALVFIAFIEPSFFPIPPDVLLMALCFAHPKRWAHFAFW